MEAIRQLLKAKEGLAARRREIDSELDAIDRAVRILQRDEQAQSDAIDTKRFKRAGLAEGCRLVVGSEWIAPVEVRDVLLAGGYQAKSKTKLLNGVYATCKRLADTEFDMADVGGKKKFRKKLPPVMGEEDDPRTDHESASVN